MSNNNFLLGEQIIITIVIFIINFVIFIITIIILNSIVVDVCFITFFDSRIMLISLLTAGGMLEPSCSPLYGAISQS